MALNILNINKYEHGQCNQLAGTILLDVVVLRKTLLLLFTPLVLFAYLWTEGNGELSTLYSALSYTPVQHIHIKYIVQYFFFQSNKKKKK